MPRFSNPVPQYLDNNGDPLPGGSLTFFVSGTSTKAETYSDAGQSVLNTNPIILDGDGRLPNVFFSGSIRGVLRNKDNVLIWERDFIGSDISKNAFGDWIIDAVYDEGDIVTGSDGLYYVSLVDANLGNDPTTSPEEWTQIKFIRVWNEFETYVLNQIVQSPSGFLFNSTVEPNLNINPDETNENSWIQGVQQNQVTQHFYRNR